MANLAVNPTLQDWTQGTASPVNGQTAVALSGASLISTDPTTGATLQVASRGDIFYCNNAWAVIASVVDANNITLLAPGWTGSSASAAVYGIIRQTRPATGPLAQTMQTMLAAGSASAPWLQAVIDDSTARINLANVSGVPTVAVGPTGTPIASLKAALQISPTTGDVTFPFGISLHAAPSRGYLYKADYTTPAFSVTGAGTISVKAGTVVDCAGVLTNYTAATAVTMPSLTAGTDYAIYQCSDGSLRADASFTAPAGYTTANSRMIGGFHYAPGGNAAARAGGDATPAINPYSLWDLKFRPRCLDPRGMALVAGRFWCDVYLTNTTPDASGTSRYGLSIASGSRLPVIPAAFGGDGSTAYGEFNWWDANEVVASVGKRLLSTEEFQIAAYGTTEESSLSSDPGTTGFQNGTYTSKWGLFQATGCYWVWGRELGGPYSAASWTQSTGNRGQFYEMPNAVILGGNFGSGAGSGSRASYWNNAASGSDGSVGARGGCDHLMLV